MTIGNWNGDPELISSYTDVLNELKDRDTITLQWAESTVTTPIINFPVDAKRWNPTAFRWEKWDGSSWVNLSNLYQINVAQLEGKSASDFLLAAARGAANGVASLDSNTKIPQAQIGDLDAGSNTTGYAWKHRRYTTPQLAAATGSLGEIVINTTTKRAFLMDGATAGGLAIAMQADLNDINASTLNISGNGRVAGVFNAGSNTTGLVVDGSNMSFGVATPENAEGFNRVFDVLGGGTARVSLRTVAGILGQITVNDGTYYTSTGMRVGTRSNHQLALMAGGTTPLLLKPNNKIVVGATTANQAIDNSLMMDVYGATRFHEIIVQDNFASSGGMARVYFGLNRAHCLEVNKDTGVANFVGFNQLQLAGTAVAAAGTQVGDLIAATTVQWNSGGGTIFNPQPGSYTVLSQRGIGGAYAITIADFRAALGINNGNYIAPDTLQVALRVDLSENLDPNNYTVEVGMVLNAEAAGSQSAVVDDANSRFCPTVELVNQGINSIRLQPDWDGGYTENFAAKTVVSKKQGHFFVYGVNTYPNSSYTASAFLLPFPRLFIRVFKT